LLDAMRLGQPADRRTGLAQHFQGGTSRVAAEYCTVPTGEVRNTAPLVYKFQFNQEVGHGDISR
jgi:hypothetical protein